MTRSTRRRAAALALGLALVAGCGTGGGGTGASAVASSAQAGRLAGLRLFVDPDSTPAQQVRLLRASGHAQSAEVLQERVASRPLARWFTGDGQGDPFPRAQALGAAAARAGRVPVVTVYDLPGRDCGQFSAGGAPSDEAYLQYVGALSAGLTAGLGDRPAVVVLEPDAVAHGLQDCGTSGPRTQALLRRAVGTLTRAPSTRVYLDAGNASWVQDLPGLAGALRASGLDQADGFALNVANFETTQASADYGRRLSDLLGGAHFVVDTSRNGAGPPPGQGSGAAHGWCNPPGRRLGAPPTTDPRLPRVDALLWVKSPGDSDGSCGPGQPPAGAYSRALADDLLR